ncbi:rRNA-processing protein CGR1 [Chaetomium sp. MPI-SDFR-AT-0129]|nr:rRNA-processing protein CGR1 [Chaetomium sp. MPI-SDFR-AT-0129]
MSMTMVEGTEVKEAAATKPLGMRKNGKQWHAPKKAFRPTSGLTSYAKRAKDRISQAATKTKEKELKEEKEAERQKRITALKEKRAAKEEKERYEMLAAKMHKKRLERLKRKEKRNKLLNS